MKLLEPFDGKCAFGLYGPRVALVAVDRTMQSQPTVVLPTGVLPDCLGTWLVLLAKNPYRTPSSSPVGQPDEMLRIPGVTDEDRLIRDGVSGMVAFFHNTRADYVALSRMRASGADGAGPYESTRVTMDWEGLTLNSLADAVIEIMR